MTDSVISIVAAMCLLIVAETSAQPASVWESRMRAAETATEDGRFADAEAALREGLAEVERIDAYAVVLRGLGRESEADGLESRARQIRAAR